MLRGAATGAAQRALATTAPASARRQGASFSALVGLVGGGLFAWSSYELTDSRSSILTSVVMPLFRLLDPETAHVLAIQLAKRNLAPRDRKPDDPLLATTVFGRDFSNPIGLAAGFDKHAEAIDGLLRMGFGFVEVGSVTPQPQPGNPKPRMFRLTEDRGVINRYGFNSEGIEAAESRLADRQRRPLHPPGLVGINLGKNKVQTDALADYRTGLLALGPYADYIVINVSSPNTPGLRALQNRAELETLVTGVQAARALLPNSSVPLLLKIAPDLRDDEKRDIAEVVLALGVDGLIVSNTTISRPSSLKSEHKGEVGGLSGAPLRELATKTVGDMYRLTGGKVPIIGVGGVSSGADAFEKIASGASLVQLYSALSYEGPPLIPRIKDELAAILREKGFKSVSEAVGSAVKLS